MSQSCFAVVFVFEPSVGLSRFQELLNGVWSAPALTPVPRLPSSRRLLKDLQEQQVFAGLPHFTLCRFPCAGFRDFISAFSVDATTIYQPHLPACSPHCRLSTTASYTPLCTDTHLDSRLPFTWIFPLAPHTTSYLLNPVLTQPLLLQRLLFFVSRLGTSRNTFSFKCGVNTS